MKKEFEEPQEVKEEKEAREEDREKQKKDIEKQKPGQYQQRSQPITVPPGKPRNQRSTRSIPAVLTLTSIQPREPLIKPGCIPNYLLQ